MADRQDKTAVFHCGPGYERHVQALWSAYLELVKNEVSFKSNCSDDPRGWFDWTEYKPVKHDLIDVMRQVILRSEAHVTLSCFYVDMAHDASLLKKDSEFAKKGEYPQRRAAADFSTMVSNYELFAFDLAARLANLSFHNNAQKMANRFHITPNRADPFLNYEATVMESLRLWSRKDPDGDEKDTYKFTPGPMLHDFVRLIEDAVSRGMQEIAAVLANQPSPNLLGPRALAKLPPTPRLFTPEEEDPDLASEEGPVRPGAAAQA